MWRHALVLAIASCKPAQVQQATPPRPVPVEDRSGGPVPKAVSPDDPRGPAIAWNVSGDVCEFAVVGSDAVVAVHHSGLHRRDKGTGVRTWTRPIRGWLSNDETAVFVASLQELIAVDIGDGTERWRHELFGLSKTDGSEAWSIPGHTLSLVQPRAHEGLVYAVIPEHRRISSSRAWYVSSVAEVDPATGERHWQQWFEQPVRGKISVTEDRIHAASWDGKLYELDRHSGEIRWAMDLGLGHGHPTVLTDDEAVYVCGGDRLVRIDLPSI